MENRSIPSSTATPDTPTNHPSEPHKKRHKGRRGPAKPSAVTVAYSDFDGLLVDMYDIGKQVVTADLFDGLKQMLMDFTREEIAFAYLVYVNYRMQYRDYRMGEDSMCLPYCPRDFVSGGRALVLSLRQSIPDFQDRVKGHPVEPADDPHSVRHIEKQNQRRCGFTLTP